MQFKRMNELLVFYDEDFATVAQMERSQLHPTRNLQDPIDADFNWVGSESISQRIEGALTLSTGFGGVNTALCLGNAGRPRLA